MNKIGYKALTNENIIDGVKYQVGEIYEGTVRHSLLEPSFAKTDMLDALYEDDIIDMKYYLTEKMQQ